MKMLSAETYRKVVVQATVSHDDEERVLLVSYLLSSLNIEHNEGKTEDLQKHSEHSWFLTPMCTKSVCGVFAGGDSAKSVCKFTPGAASLGSVPKRLHWFLAGPMVDGQMFGDNSEKTKTPESGSVRVL